jgi:hypothetical protein
MRDSRHRGWIVALTLVAGLMLVGVGGASATLTGWKNFGTGNVAARGTQGWAYVSIRSTTLRNPAAIQFAIEGVPARSVEGNWAILCWNGDSQTFANGSFDAMLPITRKITAVPVAAWQYCELWVSVSAVDFDPGTLSVKLQARYPTP